MLRPLESYFSFGTEGIIFLATISPSPSSLTLSLLPCTMYLLFLISLSLSLSISLSLSLSLSLFSLSPLSLLTSSILRFLHRDIASNKRFYFYFPESKKKNQTKTTSTENAAGGDGKEAAVREIEALLATSLIKGLLEEKISPKGLPRHLSANEHV